MTPLSLSLRARIGLAGFVQIAHAFFVALRAQVDVGIFGALARRAGADFQVDGIAVGPVDQTMAVGNAGPEPGGIAGAHDNLAVVFAQHNLPGQHVDELILGGMPVALRRGGAGFQRGQVDAELGEPGGVAEPLAHASEHDLAERLGISGHRISLEVIDIDLRHLRSSGSPYTRSTMVAVPMPIPMHRVTSAVAALRRSISSIAVPRIMAPVAPSGWPSAMAPPLTLIFVLSRSKACMNRSTTEANASLTSNKSMSPSDMPALRSTFLVTSSGPVSMMAGSEPILANALIRARGLRLARRPASALPINTAAAPSTIPEELPAWCT